MSSLFENFDEIDFFESELDPPIVEGSTLTIPVRGILLMPAHPENDTGAPLSVSSAYLVFSDVVSSFRVLHEYVDGDRKSSRFLPKRVQDDGPFDSSEKEISSREFELEGILTHPLAWTDWKVLAGAFRLEKAG